MNILLIEDDETAGVLIQPLLEKNFNAKVTLVNSLQSAVELLEGPWEPSDLIICDYHGNSLALLKCMLSFCQDLPCILVVEDDSKMGELNRVRGAILPDPVLRKFLSKQLLERIIELHAQKIFKDKDGAAKEFVLDAKTKDLLDKQQSKLEKLIEAPTVDPVEAREVTVQSLEVIHDLTGKMGFTPQVQAIATKSVELTLKLLGNKPRLSAITNSLKRNEGQYLASHSIMLAEICCAIACGIGWNSAPTFFKLTLAAYLHDMSIKENDLARCQTLDEAKKLTTVSQEGIMGFRLHPARAAELARRFHEIPPDVDTIIAQHHELQDGTGFPRGLFLSQLTPLSCLFNIAEEMLHFFLDHEGEGNVAKYVEENSHRYPSGVFKKIMKSLAGEPK